MYLIKNKQGLTQHKYISKHFHQYESIVTKHD